MVKKTCSTRNDFGFKFKQQVVGSLAGGISYWRILDLNWSGRNLTERLQIRIRWEHRLTDWLTGQQLICWWSGQAAWLECPPSTITTFTLTPRVWCQEGFSPRNFSIPRPWDIRFKWQNGSEIISVFTIFVLSEPYLGQQILTLRTPIKSAQSQALLEFFVHKTNFCHFSGHNMRILVKRPAGRGIGSVGCPVWL